MTTTPDYAGLIERLRSHEERWECAGGGGWETPEVCIQAAAALEAQAAELAAVKEMYAREGAKALYELERAERAEAKLAEAMKALGLMLREHDILSGNFGDVMDPKHRRPDRWPIAAEAARRALTGGQEE